VISLALPSSPGLAQDAAGRVVHHRQQVQLRRVVVAAAAQGLAVDGDRHRQDRAEALGWNDSHGQLRSALPQL
jgi:hypothetical protein